MANKLTRKRKVFVETFVETGVAAEAAREAFDIDPENHQLAASMGHEYLSKPEIQQAIAEKTKEREAMVEEAHDSLLTAVRLDYFVFPKAMSDEEIIGHLTSVGLITINIRPSDKGKLAFFSLPDGAARSKGIELHHKVKGTFAPDKHVNVNVEVETSASIKELTKRLNEIHRSTGQQTAPAPVQSNGQGTE